MMHQERKMSTMGERLKNSDPALHSSLMSLQQALKVVSENSSSVPLDPSEMAKTLRKTLDSQIKALEGNSMVGNQTLNRTQLTELLNILKAVPKKPSPKFPGLAAKTKGAAEEALSIIKGWRDHARRNYSKVAKQIESFLERS